jgi:hypothetical protein
MNPNKAFADSLAARKSFPSGLAIRELEMSARSVQPPFEQAGKMTPETN